MKRFEFQLQSVLDMRKMREEEALRGLAHKQYVRMELIHARQEHLHALDAVKQKREDLGHTSTLVATYGDHDAFIQGQKIRIFQSDQEIFQAELQVEKAMKKYRDCRRQTHMIEKLLENAYAEYHRKKKKYEEKVLDDLVLTRFSVNKTEDDGYDA